MSYRITKTYGHDLGLSACFRQPKATSHCRFLHGYALSFKFTFEADTLDENNWVLNFGALKPLKAWLEQTFDHKLLVAEDDPARDYLQRLASPLGMPVVAGTSAMGWHQPVADALVLPAIGCEAFAKLAFDKASYLLAEMTTRQVAPLINGVRVVEVEVREHGANSAIYMGEGR